jgi:hypothetical protein
LRSPGLGKGSGKSASIQTRGACGPVAPTRRMLSVLLFYVTGMMDATASALRGPGAAADPRLSRNNRRAHAAASPAPARGHAAAAAAYDDEATSERDSDASGADASRVWSDTDVAEVAAAVPALSRVTSAPMQRVRVTASAAASVRRVRVTAPSESTTNVGRAIRRQRRAQNRESYDGRRIRPGMLWRHLLPGAVTTLRCGCLAALPTLNPVAACVRVCVCVCVCARARVCACMCCVCRLRATGAAAGADPRRRRGYAT